MDYVVLVEDNLHEIGGTYGWEPLWRREIAIYEEEDNHFIHAWIIICFGLLRLYFLLLFSRVAVLFSTKVFLVGNPYLILREGEVLWATFPHSSIFAKLPPSAIAQFLFRVGLCCRVQQRRISLGHFWACFSVESLSIHWRVSKEDSWAYFYIFGIRPTIFYPSQHSFHPELRYFWRHLLGGFIELIRRVYF